jgi:hypothetical protein
MTIPTTPELLADGVRPEEQRRRVCGAAAQIMNYCGEVIPKPLKTEMFAFASNMLLKASKVEIGQEAEADGPRHLVEPLVQLTQDEKDLEIDQVSQTMLQRLSGDSITEIVEYARKGAEYATIVTTYPVQIGRWAFDVVRTRSLHDPTSPIDYTVQNQAAIED